MQHTAQDRCDRCRAQGYTTWVNKAGNPLTFCGHHGSSFTYTLIAQGFRLALDDTQALHQS